MAPRETTGLVLARAARTSAAGWRAKAPEGMPSSEERTRPARSSAARRRNVDTEPQAQQLIELVGRKIFEPRGRQAIEIARSGALQGWIAEWAARSRRLVALHSARGAVPGPGRGSAMSVRCGILKPAAALVPAMQRRRALNAGG